MLSDETNNSEDTFHSQVPVHVAVIMDGNGRWANSRGTSRHKGHHAGVEAVRATVEIAAKRGVSYLTLFAFSSENWRRPADEVTQLMRLFIEALQREVDDLHHNNVCLRFIGEREQLQRDLVRKIEAAEGQTCNNDGLRLIIAASYGGRWDIVEATKSLVTKATMGRLIVEDIDENVFADELSLAGVPDPDLLIRTGGERRVSNFLLWDLAYAEMWFSDCLWPDFREAEFDEALQYFSSRQRRYGHTGDQVV
jgi:undecaprenyl diphosphate synthase